MPVYTFSTFDDPSASTGATNAFGINDTGQIVGSYRDPMNVFHGFLLSGGTYTPLTDPLATNSTTAVGINAAGQIVGRYHNGTGTHGFLYNGGIYSTLDVPSATLTAASGINSSGVVVGTYRNASGAHGFIYDLATWRTRSPRSMLPWPSATRKQPASMTRAKSLGFT